MDGQLVISHDILGNFVGDIRPKFVSRFANLDTIVTDAFSAYAAAVRSGSFPSREHLYPLEPAEAAAIAARKPVRRERQPAPLRIPKVQL